MSGRLRVSQALAALLALLSAVPIIWYWLDLASQGTGPFDSRYVGSIVVGQGAGLGAVVIALLIAWRAWDHSGATRSLAFFLGAFCLYNGSLGLTRSLRAVFPDYGGAVYDVVFGVAVGFGVGALVRFSALFPTVSRGGHRSSGRWRDRGRWLRQAFSRPAPVVIGATLLGIVAVSSELLDWSGMIGAGPAVELGLPLGFSVASVNLWTSYADALESDRSKIFWVAEGVALLFLGIVFPVALDLALGAFGRELPQFIHWYAWAASMWGFIVCLAFAVFGRGAIPAGLLFRRTTLTGGVTVIALFFFAGLEDLVTDLVLSRTSLPDATGSWVAGGLVAVLLSPLYRRLERGLNASRRGAA